MRGKIIARQVQHKVSQSFEQIAKTRNQLKLEQTAERTAEFQSISRRGAALGFGSFLGGLFIADVMWQGERDRQIRDELVKRGHLICD